MLSRLSLFVLLAGTPAWAADAGLASTGPTLIADPVLQAIVQEAMERRPELAQARAEITAEKERVPQSKALPDPILSLGIQNDGFSSIQIGKMETSFFAIGASQTLPWLGKRGLRGEVAGIGTRQAEADLQRARLTIAADVERAYVELLLVRDRLGLLAKLEDLWTQSEGLARVRYEAGDTPQSDLLRAQLQINRLRQQRWALEADERRSLAILNRLRGQTLTAPIETTRTLADVPDPGVPDADQEVAAAERESPELRKALLAGDRADRRVELARKERWPDLTVNAGIMPRGGPFPTMWQAGVAVNVPIWTAQKQSRSIAENQARGEAARSGAEAIRQLLRQRVHERLRILAGLVETNRLYRSGLLAQSEATVSSTLAQYQVGRVTFASVLEALAGYLSDLNGFFDSVAATQAIAIAEREISLDAPGGASGGGMGGAKMPGAGATSAGAAANRGGAQPEGGESSGPSMSRM